MLIYYCALLRNFRFLVHKLNLNRAFKVLLNLESSEQRSVCWNFTCPWAYSSREGLPCSPNGMYLCFGSGLLRLAMPMASPSRTAWVLHLAPLELSWFTLKSAQTPALPLSFFVPVPSSGVALYGRWFLMSHPRCGMSVLSLGEALLFCRALF